MGIDNPHSDLITRENEGRVFVEVTNYRESRSVLRESAGEGEGWARVLLRAGRGIAMPALAYGGGRLRGDPTRGPGAPGRSAQGRDSLACGVPNGHSCILARAVSSRTLPPGSQTPPNKTGDHVERRGCRQVFFLFPELGKGPAPCPARLALLGSLPASREPVEQRRAVSPFLRFLTCPGAENGGSTAEVRFALSPHTLPKSAPPRGKFSVQFI